MCEGPRPLGRSPRFPGGARWRALLQHHRLPAALAVADLERHLLALLHVVPAGALQHGGVEEHVLAAVVRGDEAEAAHLVEPLHRAADVVGRAAGVAAEVAPRRPIAEAPRRAVAEAATAAAALAALQLRDAGDEASALAVRADLADQRVAGVGRFYSRLGQRRGVEEHVLTVGPQHKAEALAGVVPLHLGLDRPGPAHRIAIGR